MVVAAGPAQDGRLDQGVCITRELGPDEAALVVEADEAVLELRRRLGVRGPLHLGDQLPGLLRRPVLRRQGQVGVRLAAWRRRPAGAKTSRVRRPSERAAESAGSVLHLRGGLDQRAGPGAADVAAGDQPVAHGQRSVAAPGLRAIELGDLTEHGALVLGDDPLMAPDAVGQLGRARITSVVPTEGSGPAGRRGPAGTSRAGTLGRQLPYRTNGPRRRLFGAVTRQAAVAAGVGAAAAEAEPVVVGCGCGWRSRAMVASSITMRKPT